MGMFVYETNKMPGPGPTRESIEGAFAWGKQSLSIVYGVPISGAARDAGNTPTTLLRHGLLMGIITASKLAKQYDPAATDGSQLAVGFLANPGGVRVTDIEGNNQTNLGILVVGGPIRASSVFGLDAQSRAHLFGRCLFDDDLVGNRTMPHQLVVAKAADYTVLAADSGTLFTNRGATGAVVFTLPAIARGLHFRFYAEAAQNLTVTAATADTIVTFDDLAADSVTLAGGSNAKHIGASLAVFANDAGDKWLTVANGFQTTDTAGQNRFTVAT